MDTTIAKEKYGDRNLFATEKVHGIEMCIGSKFQKKANHINTPFEKQAMFNVNFLKELTQYSAIPSYLVNKSMAAEHVQKAFRVLADKLRRV
jgi:hypothetical protein